MSKRIVSIITVLCLSLSLFAFAAPTGYGRIPIYVGSAEVDYMADELLKEIPTAGKTATEQIRAVYDWIIYNCERYEWDGVNHFDEKAVAAAAPDYAKRAQAKIEAGTAVIREELAYHFQNGDIYDSDMYVSSYARTMLIQRTGNCAHFSSLLSVLLGHLGYDCRVIGGNFINRDGTRPVHKWNCVLVDGKYYWLDVRMDHATYGRTGKIDYHYFMVTDLARWESSHEWDHAYSNALFANPAEVAGIYEEAAFRNSHPLNVNVVCSRSGNVSGGGKYLKDDIAYLYAYSGNADFAGWYDKWGNLVTDELSYSFTVDRDITLYALFEDDVFADIPANAWYLDAALTAYKAGLVTGTTAVTFDGKKKFTRAMAAVLLYRLSGDAAPETSAPFDDVPQGKWFTEAAAWGYENGVIRGKTDTQFAPDDPITRQEFATMAVRFIAARCVAAEGEGTAFTDSADISAYAAESVMTAAALGLVKGYPDGSFKPKAVLSRAEGTTMIVRITEILDKAKEGEKPSDKEQTEAGE